MNGTIVRGAADRSSRPSTIDLAPGEEITGTVLRLPAPGEHLGNYLLLDCGAMPATAKLGHTVLGRELERGNVTAGDRIVVRFRGMRKSAVGKRQYRAYSVRKR